MASQVERPPHESARARRLRPRPSCPRRVVLCACRARRAARAADRRARGDRRSAADPPADDGRSVRAVPARSGEHRGRVLSAPARPVRQPARGARAEPALPVRSRPHRPAAARTHARRGARRAEPSGGALPGLLPAELPLSDRRLSQRAFRGRLRLPGRGPVQGRRRCHAPPGAGADRGVPARPADPRAAAAGRGVRHRPLPRLRQAELSAPAGGRRGSQPGVSAPGAARPRRVVMGRPGLGPRRRRCRLPTPAAIS